MFIILIAAGDKEWALADAMDAGSVRLTTAPPEELPDLRPVIPRIWIDTPPPYYPASCWAFDAAVVPDALEWLIAHGYGAHAVEV